MNVEEMADRLEIQDLNARYNRAIDNGDAEGWADTFTPDGVFHGIVVHCEGRDELVAWVHELWSNPSYAHFINGQHWIGNAVLEFDGDAGKMWSNVIMVVPSADGARVSLLGVFTDELRRLDGRWLLARRTLTTTVA